MLSVTTDDQGWTVFGRSADTRIVYVSSSAGNDANSGLSESAAVKTLAKAKTLIRNGAPDWMLLKRGDAWTENLTGWTKSGRSSSEMMVLGAYGTGARPTLNTGTAGGFSNSNTAISNVAIVGISFHAHTRDTASPTYGGITAGSVGFNISGNVRTMLLEDVVFDDYTYNLSLTGQAGRIRDFTMRRSIVTDAWSTDGKAQGLYADEVDGFVLEENVFDHNGWNEVVPGAAANIYSHGVYMSSDNSGVVVRGNVVADSSSHGVMARSGGIIEDNVFLRNPINLTFGGGSPTVHPGGVEGHITGNVFLDSRSIAGSARGTGVELSNLKPGAGVLVANNIFTADTHRNTPAITFATTSDATNLSQSMGINDLTIRDNIVYDWYSGFSMPSSMRLGGTGHTGVNDVRVEDNDFQNTAIARIVRYGRPVNTAELFFGANRYASTFAPSGWFEVNGVTTSYDTWKATAEPTAIQAAGAYADPARSIAAYNVSLGGDAAFTAFMPLLRAQDRQTLDGRYTAQAIINYVRAGFTEGGVIPGGELALHGASTTDATPAGAPAADPADTTGPGATLSTAPANVTSGGIAAVQFTVTYTDASAVDLNSIGTGDVKVTGPNGYNQNATQVSKTTADNGKTVVVVYSAPAPGGYWDVTDAGTYALALVSGAAKDTLNNNSAAVASFGTFTADVPPDTAAPTVTAATPSDITTGGTAPQTFTVTYTDDTAIDLNTVGTGDIVVTLPDGTTQAATYVSRVASNNNKTVVATYVLAAPGGFWDVTDNGTYAFAFAGGAVADVLGQGAVDATLGSFVVNVPWVDIFAPVPALGAPSHTTAGINPYTFTVTFTDDTGVDPATIGANDVTVTGPGGAVSATFVGQQSSNNGETITATFSIAAPGGYWDAGDNGSYQVALVGGVVKDILGNTAGGQSLGAITVNVAADGVAPAASLTAATVTAVGSDKHTFIVTYTDSTGVDVSTIGDGDAQVTGPASYSQLANFVSSTASADGKTVTATYTIPAPGGEWDFFDNGTYAVKLTTGAVSDLGGNAVASGQIGTFNALILDTIAPIASLIVSDITTAGGATQSFTITYDDDLGINFASVGAGDVRVTGPNGAIQVAALASKVSSNGGKTVTATYTIAAPGGAWDRADNGTYGVDIASAQVSDVGGNLVAVGEIGSFAVNIADTTAPTASLSAGNITVANSAAYTFTVTYSDDTAVDISTIGDGDLTATGPGGYSQSVTLVSTQSPNAQTVVATYSIPARGGDWDFGDNGTYSISLAGDAVSDASGNAIAAASPLGTFAVNVPQPADTTAPTATLAVNGITTGGGTTHTFTVTYTDDRAIDVNGVGSTGVSVTGPGGYSQAATLVSKTATNAKTVVVTYTIPAAGSSWDPADNGTYTVALAAGAVADAAGNGNGAATLGTFAVSVPDTTAPTASLAASNITAASGGAYTFTVTYADELAIDPATVGSGDVVVTGPGGFSQVATFVSKTSPNGKSVIGTYSITGAGGAWDFADNGSYTVSMQAGQVRDGATNPVAAGAIGGFSVIIAQPDTTAPTATLPAVSTITTITTAAKTFTVTYTDAGGINLTTLGAGDVQVTGPNNYNQAATFVSQSSPDGGKTVNAVYSVTAPGGTWDSADNGTYTIALLAAAVKDVAGNSSAAATLGSFAVNIAPQPITLNTSISTYVRDGTASAKKNFGTASDLQVQQSSSTGNRREAYLRFDLSTITSVSSAKLRLNGKLSGAGSVAVAVYGSSNITWSESAITWNTKLATNTAALASKTITSTSYAWHEFDVTAYLQQLKAAGATAVTFVLRGTTNTSINATFRSDEYSTVAERPQLVVTPAVVTPSLVVSQTNISVSEGGNASFTVALSSAPLSDVVVTVARTAGDADVTASPTTITFTPANWNVPRTVALGAAQDADSINGSATISVSATGLSTRTLAVTELDDDLFA